MGIHHSVTDGLMKRLQANGMVDEGPRSGRHLKTTHREERLIAGSARRNRFTTSTSACIPDEMNFGGHVSVTRLRIYNEILMFFNGRLCSSVYQFSTCFQLF